MPNAISFFTGAGGLDMGIQAAGFNIKLCVEIEPIYCETLELNHPNLNIQQGNIMDYDKNKILKEAGLNDNEKIDLIFGGSPCQSFSTAGKRQAFSDPRGQAMIKFAQIVSEIRPKMFLLENVRGLLSAALKHRPINQRGKDFPPLTSEEEAGSALKYLLKHFKGYDVKVKLLNSADYGVPQKRERVFIIGIEKSLNKSYDFPSPTHDEKGTNGKHSWVTFDDVMKRMNITSHHHVNYSEERLKYMKLIPKGGGNWRDLPPDVVKKAMGGAYESGGGKVGYFRRLHIDRPSPTLVTSPHQKSTNLGHPFYDRPLSIEEYLAIQEFPRGYKVAGTLAQQYIQIGNAVPVRLAEQLGNSIMNSLYETVRT